MRLHATPPCSLGLWWQQQLLIPAWWLADHATAPGAQLERCMRACFAGWCRIAVAAAQPALPIGREVV